MPRPSITRRHLLATGSAAAVLPRLAAAQGRRSVTDDAGRVLSLPPRIERVFAAGPPAAVLTYAIAPERLIGWTSAFRPEEKAFVPPRFGDLPGLGRLTGRGNTANIESVLAAKADLILDFGAVNPTFVSLAERTQEQSGIPYALLDGRFDRMPAAARLLGDILGDAPGGAALAAYAEDTIAAIDRLVASVPAGRRPRVYYARGPRGLDTGMAGSINVESIERLGAVNVAAALGRGGLTTVSMEQILAWDPEVIVTIDSNFARHARQDPTWHNVAAVKAGRVHLSPWLPFGWVDFPPSINRLIGLHWLARVLYPDKATGDLRARVLDFYDRFYHQAPSPAQLDALLADLQ